MAGHDYRIASEVTGGQDWSLCANGTRHPGAVRGAIDDFAIHHGLQFVVTYQESWASWYVRKPMY
jgi:hypothetical protein